MPSSISGAKRAFFEMDFRKRFKSLAVRLRKIEQQVFNVIIQSMSSARMNAAHWNQTKKEINDLYRNMNKAFDDWSKVEIPMSYRNNIHVLSRRLKSVRGVIARKSVEEVINSTASAQIMSGLYSTSINSFVSATVGGNANLRNLFVATQQRLVDESLINVAVGQGFESGSLRQSKSLLSAIFQSPEWTRVENLQFVRAGNMNYRPSQYAEMVARTKFHQAQSQAAIMQAVNHGTDLVEISSHNTSTKICIPFEGNIYSISGRSTRYPPLTQVPPFHPNCLHLAFPVFESALEAA